MTNVQVRPLGYALGAAVTGIDVRERLDAQTVRELRRLWLENLLLCFPGQNLDKLQFIEFAKNFGVLETIREANRDAASPNIGFLTNKPVNGTPWNGYKGGTTWHSDENYTTQPTSATLVHAKEIPETGGDTMFANQHLAYETLSPAMKTMIDGLEVVQFLPERAAPPALSEFPTVQPLVRVHPETGRKALFVGHRARRIHGMSEDESRPLLSYLNEHAIRYEFVYRHRWTAGDVIMWDNRALLHIALRDYDERTQPRHMFRTACLGEPSGYPYTGDEARPAAAAAS